MKLSWFKPASRTFLGSLLVLAMAFHSVAENAYPFKDIDFKHWAAQPAYVMGKHGFMKGLKPDQFGGEVPLSRYQFATILNSLLQNREISSTLVVVFTDIAPGHPQFDEISRVTRSGIMEMLTGTFDGNKGVTRQEFAQGMDRLLKFMAATIPSPPRTKKLEFTDIDEPYKEAVSQVANAWQLTEGYGNKSFKGKQEITRFEALAMLSKAAALLSEDFRTTMAQPMPAPPLEQLISASINPNATAQPQVSASSNNTENLETMLNSMESPKPSVSSAPSVAPSAKPSVAPTPTVKPSATPTAKPPVASTAAPTTAPTAKPAPTTTPSAKPSVAPTAAPTAKPTATPTATSGPDDLETLLNNPSAKPSGQSSGGLSELESLLQGKPSSVPTAAPSAKPSVAPTPTVKPSATPTAKPPVAPTAAPTPAPTAKPSPTPTAAPSTKSATASPGSDDLESLLNNASAKPSVAPTAVPTAKTSTAPTAKPTPGSDDLESLVNSAKPSATPAVKPSVGSTSELEQLLQGNPTTPKPPVAPTPTAAVAKATPAPAKPSVPPPSAKPTPAPAIKPVVSATPPPVLATPKPAPSGSSVDDLARELGMPVASPTPAPSEAAAVATKPETDILAQLNLVPTGPESLLDIPMPSVAKTTLEPASPVPSSAPLGGLLRNHISVGVLTKPLYTEGIPDSLNERFPLNTQNALLTIAPNIGMGFNLDGALWLNQLPSPFLSRTGVLLNVLTQGSFTVDEVDMTEMIHANLGLMYKALSSERLELAVGLDNYFRFTASAKDPRNNYFQASRSYMGFGIKGLLGWRMFDWLTLEFSLAPHFVIHDLPNVQLAELPLKRFDITSQLLLGFDIVRLGNQKITLNTGYQLLMLLGAGDGNQVSHGVFAGTGYHF